VLNPNECDVIAKIKKFTDGGVDNANALHGNILRAAHPSSLEGIP
jgi:hypothetical protein